jgi:hypothetical protein
VTFVSAEDAKVFHMTLFLFNSLPLKIVCVLKSCWLQAVLSGEHFLGKRMLEIKVATPKVGCKNLERFVLLVKSFEIFPFVLLNIYDCNIGTLYRYMFSHMITRLVFCFGRKRCEHQQKKPQGYLWPGFHHL